MVLQHGMVFFEYWMLNIAVVYMFDPTGSKVLTPFKSNKHYKKGLRVHPNTLRKILQVTTAAVMSSASGSCPREWNSSALPWDRTGWASAECWGRPRGMGSLSLGITKVVNFSCLFKAFPKYFSTGIDSLSPLISPPRFGWVMLCHALILLLTSLGKRNNKAPVAGLLQKYLHGISLQLSEMLWLKLKRCKNLLSSSLEHWSFHFSPRTSQNWCIG